MLASFKSQGYVVGINPRHVAAVSIAADQNGQLLLGRSVVVLAASPATIPVDGSPESVIAQLNSADAKAES